VPLPLTTEVRATLGDQRIARQVNLAAHRIKGQDRPDLSQQVNVELCKDLGENYREKIGATTSSSDFKQTDEHRILVRCVDRVCKRIKRSKQHKSIDQLREDQGFIPIDPRSTKSASLTRMITLLAIQRDELGAKERLMLDLLLAETPHDEIARQLGMGRTKFFQLKREVFDEIATRLLSDD
jgi:hypothetical protein